MTFIKSCVISSISSRANRLDTWDKLHRVSHKRHHSPNLPKALFLQCQRPKAFHRVIITFTTVSICLKEKKRTYKKIANSYGPVRSSPGSLELPFEIFSSWRKTVKWTGNRAFQMCEFHELKSSSSIRHDCSNAWTISCVALSTHTKQIFVQRVLQACKLHTR